MRLSKIKVSGFKSFVDPTTVLMPSNLVGIVGPNGCGKSNTIDAVRWVMGESSAKYLRGSSMTDVIFNGSSSRKPVGQASVELVFDNSDKSAGGQFSAYNEISVRRVMTRDGQSNYYLNGSKCRKKDVTDLFLGTGLGPRSYAIIEQGMISRIIDAKPEEMRVYIEEAAGISKYKDRRRETENRLKHTRENLERLTDLREEIGNQLEKLKRQAKVAERYKAYKEEERLAKSQLIVVKLRALKDEKVQVEKEIETQNTSFQARLADQRAAETRIETTREEYIKHTESFNEIQGKYYSLGSDIAKVEQTIQHQKGVKTRQQEELQQINDNFAAITEQIEIDNQRAEDVAEKLCELEPQLEEFKFKDEELQQMLDTANEQWQSWQEDWEEFNRKATEPVQLAQVERARIDQLEKQHTQLNQRIDRIKQEQQNLTTDELRQEVEQLIEQELIYNEKTDELKQRLEGLVETINQQRENNRELSKELETVKSGLQQKQGKLTSLEVLQQEALGKNKDSKLGEWLSEKGIDSVSRLAENITVTQGWEKAVEVALGRNIEALCVDDMHEHAASVTQIPDGHLTMLDKHNRNSRDKNSVLTTISEHIAAPWPLDDLIGNIYVADDIQQALSLQPKLGVAETLITKEGVMLGSGWINYSVESDSSIGVLAREQEIKSLRASIDGEAQISERLSSTLDEGRQRLAELESQKEELQRDINTQHREVGNVAAKLSGKRMRLEQIEERLERIENEYLEIQTQVSQTEEEIELSRSKLHEALAISEEINTRREQKSHQRDEIKQRLFEIQEQVRSSKDQAHKLALELQSLNMSKTTIGQNIERMQQQQQQLAQKKEQIDESLQQMDDPSGELQEQLEDLLHERVLIEDKLTEARQKNGDIEQQIRDVETARSTAEQQVQQVREKLETLRLKHQEITVHFNTFDEQMHETGQLFDDIDKGLPQEATEQEWKEKVEQISLKIHRLGSINLAAIDEYKEQSERKTYLDSQNEDLEEALATLENAIKKIDRETRTRFKETFDKVNSGLQAMFPRLFGGGHAFLDLTGADMLDTGVSIMARPPGKKISSIQLMSGGEKALTAVALVFSIFELNPAPFCMLDEVDAPLDEANVGRFGQLVKEMSDRVQFIFITHNKSTMEISTHLMGVTMHEPGVSRVVSVDVDEAVELAAV
ncbi:MAG: chromosome segregation protein SMC [Gammaproteobacteria bacterium]|nr:MAG: chromosome segregation protein SMC [Gammaproteobacteria bacterium]